MEPITLSWWCLCTSGNVWLQALHPGPSPRLHHLVSLNLTAIPRTGTRVGLSALHWKAPSNSLSTPASLSLEPRLPEPWPGVWLQAPTYSEREGEPLISCCPALDTWGNSKSWRKNRGWGMQRPHQDSSWHPGLLLWKMTWSTFVSTLP